MGICAHKKDLFEDESPPSPMLPKQPAKRNIHKQLLDLKNIRKVPHLSLSKNPLYLRRKEKPKIEDDSNDSVSQTLEDKQGFAF
jgi:hypothetical protein